MRSEAVTAVTSRRTTTTSVNFVVPKVSESAAVLFALAATSSSFASQHQAKVSRFAHLANALKSFGASIAGSHDRIKRLPISSWSAQCEQAIESTEIGGDL